MNQEVLIEALVQTACKRRILALGPSQRLGELARQKNIQNLDDLRRWLAAGEGLSAHLANQLKAIVAKPEDPPYGPYLPLTHLADGGMGSVYLVCSPKNELMVVKTLRHNLPSGANPSLGTEFIRRFEREARITQQLTHPNVVRCLDNGQAENGTLFMVLEFVDSGDLRDLVEGRAGLTEGLALAIIYQVVDGLNEAHRIKLIHRDIKPPNIFVSKDGRAKLADFGIARSTEQNRTMLTMEGAIVGSPLYMSPEQIVTDPHLDIRSDLYALGAVLYYCLAAQPPFDGKLQEILHKHCTASIPDIRKQRPVISENTAQIITTCMQKERDRRYKDPEEMLSAVANALVKLGLTPGARIEEETRQGDLSDSSSGFRPASNPDMATMAMDLSGAGGGADGKTLVADLNLDPDVTKATSLRNDVHTIVANLLAQDDPKTGGDESATKMTMAAPLGTVSDQATMATMSVAPGPNEAVEGDFATALAADWITLAPATPGDPTAVMLYARTKIVLGKLREPPIDLCLRNYPVAVHKEACQRVSRQHLALRFDTVQNQIVAEDLNAPNGTMLDGITLKAGTSAPLDADHENILLLAGTVSLWLRCLPRRSPCRAVLTGAETPTGQSQCGMDTNHGFDAVVLSRPENRPELAYAMVLRRLTIGGPGAELVLAGARTRAACEVSLYGGRWLWRVAGSGDPWRPLAAGTELDCGGRKLVAQLGAYPQFD